MQPCDFEPTPEPLDDDMAEFVILNSNCEEDEQTLSSRGLGWGEYTTAAVCTAAANVLGVLYFAPSPLAATVGTALYFTAALMQLKK